MKTVFISKLGSVISDCETFDDVAKSFGCIGFTLPGRTLRPPKGQTQEKDKDKNNRSTTDDKE